MIDQPTVQDIAPYVDPAWREAFQMAMFLRGVPTAAVSDALVEVNDHIRASGTSAQEAFGDAQHYANSLSLPSSPSQRGGAVFRKMFAVPGIIGITGVLLITAAMGALRHHTQAAITVSYCLLSILLIGAMVFVAVAPEAWIRATFATKATKTSNRFVALGWASVFVIFCLIDIPYTVISLPALPLAVIGTLLVIVSSVITLINVPADAPFSVPPNHPQPRRHWQVSLVFGLVFPVVALVVGGLAWLLG